MNEIGQNSFTPGVTQAVFVPDQLVSGPLQLVTDTVSLSAGVLRRGTVLGQITTTKAYIQSVKRRRMAVKYLALFWLMTPMPRLVQFRLGFI
ncbi:hypothetical protein [Yersinia ruckeri]|uniref:hypothetical protein n=1 Tax=Yersinia ruckeri TaxID=29486 RepID=UPI0030C8C039